MNLIKDFFSKIFVQKSQNDPIVQTQDDSLLKEATRHAVLHAFQNENIQTTTQKIFQDELQIKSEQSDHLNAINPQVLKILEEYNDCFFRSFNISKTHYKLQFDKKIIVVQINDKDFEAELSKSDKLSISYEYIFLRLIQKEFKSLDQRLFLHAGNSAKKHHNYITGIAKKLALKVKQTGHKITVPSKSSYERSLIHGVVEKIPGVTSKSTGPHHQRRLVIYPMQNVSQMTNE